MDNLAVQPAAKRLKASEEGDPVRMMGEEKQSAPRRKRSQAAVLGDDYYNDEQAPSLGLSTDDEYCGPGLEGAAGKSRRQNLKKKCTHPDGCEKSVSSKGLCERHGGGKRCAHADGCETASQWGTPYCCLHGGGRKCTHPGGCEKSVQGGTSFCISHGGGKRCTHPDGCEKFAVSKGFCQTHGGGRRCNHESGCESWALSGCQTCRKHGAGKRCAHPEGCDKGAQGGSPFCYRHGANCSHASGCQRKSHSKGLCIDHGGSRRCLHEGGCEKAAVRKTQFCKEHGGGKRCTHTGGCDKAVYGGFKFCYDHGEAKFEQAARDKAAELMKQYKPWEPAELQAFEEAVEQHSIDEKPDWMAVARAMEGMRDQAQVFAWARLYIHQKEGGGAEQVLVEEGDGEGEGEGDGL